MQFPSIGEGRSVNLNDYTFEELAEYSTIYLGSFSYEDKESAEDLILRLSRAGVKIIMAGRRDSGEQKGPQPELSGSTL